MIQGPDPVSIQNYNIIQTKVMAIDKKRKQKTWEKYTKCGKLTESM